MQNLKEFIREYIDYWGKDGLKDILCLKKYGKIKSCGGRAAAAFLLLAVSKIPALSQSGMTKAEIKSQIQAEFDKRTDISEADKAAYSQNEEILQLLFDCLYEVPSANVSAEEAIHPENAAISAAADKQPPIYKENSPTAAPASNSPDRKVSLRSPFAAATEQTTDSKTVLGTLSLSGVPQPNNSAVSFQKPQQNTAISIDAVDSSNGYVVGSHKDDNIDEAPTAESTAYNSITSTADCDSQQYASDSDVRLDLSKKRTQRRNILFALLFISAISALIFTFMQPDPAASPASVPSQVPVLPAPMPVPTSEPTSTPASTPTPAPPPTQTPKPKQTPRKVRDPFLLAPTQTPKSKQTPKTKQATQPKQTLKTKQATQPKQAHKSAQGSFPKPIIASTLSDDSEIKSDLPDAWGEIESELPEVIESEDSNNSKSAVSNVADSDSDQVPNNEKQVAISDNISKPIEIEDTRMLFSKAYSGDMKAQHELGTAYYKGNRIERNYVEAVKWFKKAAEQGNPIALINLGYCYFSGNGTLKDYAKTAQCFKTAAEQGNTTAQYNLGECYFYGIGVFKDYSEAIKWYKKAAANSDKNAQYNLGLCYEHGYGAEKDYFEALKWYRKAAEQGHANAQFKIGHYYEFRKKEFKDHDRALEWYSKAAEGGNTKAKKALKRFGKYHK